MNVKETVFQALDKAINGNWQPQVSPHVNTYDMSSLSNKVIYRTTDKADYEQKKLELKQDAYLQNRWVRANVNLSVAAYAGLGRIQLMYRDADFMDSMPEIGAALDIVSEESVLPNPIDGSIVNIYSKSDRVKRILEDLFVNRLNIQLTGQMIIRAMCKYGNQFMLLDVDHKNGVKGWKQLPVSQVERIENGIRNPYGAGVIVGDGKNIDMSTQFVWTDENSSLQAPFRDWQVAHFRLLNNSMYLPYGCLVGDTRIETETGYKEMSNIQIGDKVWTFNTETQERELGEVTMFMPKGEKDVYRVGTFHNEIEGTSDHKLLVYEGNTLKYKEIGQLEIGDLIIIDNSTNKQNSRIAIDKSYPTDYESFNRQETKYDISDRKVEGFKTEKVRRIEYVGKKQTYDFTVNNDNSNFFANGIVTHNCSYLNPARRSWRMLSLMEDAMFLYRLERSMERRVYKIFVGAIDDADVPAYVERVANEFKRTPIIDPQTGQIDLRKNILSVQDDIFVPVRDQNAPTPIDTLAAGQNMTALDDIKYVQNKICAALRIPKSFLNFEEATGDGKNLALMDIRFTRTINRIQQAFLMELTKVATIHLFLLGFDDELTNFTLSMNNPSTQAEQLEIENMQKKIGAVRDAVSDPGNGIPAMSLVRALKQIMKWSEKDIKENFEEIRLEKGLAAELEKTTQIIKKTGIFDSIDRIYGEPGAEYMDDQQGQGGMDGGPGGGGGGPMGGGPTDFGDELGGMDNVGADDSGDIAGNEGAAPVGDMNADTEAAAPQPMEGVSKKGNLILDDLMRKYLKTLKEDKREGNMLHRVEPHDMDGFFLNEEMDRLRNSLTEFVNEKEEEKA